MGFVACALIAVLVLLASVRGTNSRERSLLQLGFLAHGLGSVAIVVYHTYLTGGDMLGYAFYGRQLEHLMSLDLVGTVPEVVKLALHLDNDLPFFVSYDSGTMDALGGVTTTTTMFALTGLVMLVVGANLFTTSLAFGLFAFAGTAYFYKQLRSRLLEHERLPLLRAMMFVPSVVFWSSGIVKEAVVLGFFGFLGGGLLAFVEKPRFGAALLSVGGLVGVGMVKPYVIFPFALAVGAWLDARRGQRHGWFTRIAAVALALGVLALLSWVFPQFGVERLAESMASQQSAATTQNGGSNIEIGPAEERSLAGQLQFIPLALLNALARPFIFEARNPAMVLASFETLAAAALVVLLLARHGARGLYRIVMQRPPFVAAVAFVLSFSAAVGLATTNLGTLTRYRLPMVPFYVGVLLAVHARGSMLAKKNPLVTTRQRKMVTPRRAAIR